MEIYSQASRYNHCSPNSCSNPPHRSGSTCGNHLRLRRKYAKASEGVTTEQGSHRQTQFCAKSVGPTKDDPTRRTKHARERGPNRDPEGHLQNPGRGALYTLKERKQTRSGMQRHYSRSAHIIRQSYNLRWRYSHRTQNMPTLTLHDSATLYQLPGF